MMCYRVRELSDSGGYVDVPPLPRLHNSLLTHTLDFLPPFPETFAVRQKVTNQPGDQCCFLKW